MSVMCSSSGTYSALSSLQLSQSTAKQHSAEQFWIILILLKQCKQTD